MVVAEPEATLLTACENGYGKRTPFGPNSDEAGNGEELDDAEVDSDLPETEADAEANGSDDASEISSSNRYRTQRRGGKGIRDIKTTKRNGPVVSIVSVNDDDEVLMISARGKIQRVACREISTIGRNTQGVRIMGLDDSDTLAAVVRVPRDDSSAADDEADEAEAVEAAEQEPGAAAE